MQVDIAAELLEAREEVLRLQQVYAASVQEVAAKSRELHEASRRIANQRKELGGFAKRVRELEAEIQVRDNSANETLRILREALPNRGFHSEMEAAEGAKAEIAELRANNAKLSWAWDAVQDEDASKAADKAKSISAAVSCLNSLTWLAARDRRMKRLGAAEWIRKEAREGGVYTRHTDGMMDEAVELELEAAAGEGGE